jgi:hypothetical protein
VKSGTLHRRVICLANLQFRICRISEEHNGIILTVGVWQTASSSCPVTNWINPKTLYVFLNGWRVKSHSYLASPASNGVLKRRPYWKVFRVIHRDMHYSYWFYVTIKWKSPSALQHSSVKVSLHPVLIRHVTQLYLQKLPSRHLRMSFLEWFLLMYALSIRTFVYRLPKTNGFQDIQYRN